MAQNVIYLRECFIGTWDILLFWDGMFYKYKLNSILSRVLFKAGVSLLILCLDDLSCDVSGVLMFPTVIVLVLISLFMALSSCLIYLGAPLLGAYIFTIFMSFSWIDPLKKILWLSGSVLHCLLWFFFILRSISSDVSIATSALLLFQFPCRIFQPLTFGLYVSLGLKWVSYKEHVYDSCFCIHSASLCLFLEYLIHLCSV